MLTRSWRGGRGGRESLNDLKFGTFFFWSFSESQGSMHGSERVKETQNLRTGLINCYRTKAVALLYHWRELPQVSFLLRQKICPDKTRQNTANICRRKHNYVVTKLLLPQIYTCSSQQNTSFCRDKSMLFATNAWLSRQIFVATKLFCRDKHNFVETKLGKHTFVVASILFSRQRTCFVTSNTATNTCLRR